jgi:hypothetical protein
MTLQLQGNKFACITNCSLSERREGDDSFQRIAILDPLAPEVKKKYCNSVGTVKCDHFVPDHN